MVMKTNKLHHFSERSLDNKLFFHLAQKSTYTFTNMPSERRLSERSRSINTNNSKSRFVERRTLSRSIEGCTICRVKSARHAFVDSTKWKKYFKDVFGLSENRSAEICHLCLKAVNKWRRASKNAKPDFQNIVDSKFVPSAARRNSVRRRRSSVVEMEVGTKEDNKVALMEEDDILSADDTTDDVNSDGLPDTYFDSPSPDDDEGDNDVAFLSNGSSELKKSVNDVACQTSFLYPSLTSPQANSESFKLPYIDLSKWRQEDICCGVIFKGPSGEVLVDPKWLNSSCSMCNRSSVTPNQTTEKASKEISMFDDKLINLIQSSS